MKNLITIFALGLAIFFGPVRESHSQTMDAFLEPSTILVARVDLERVQLGELLDVIQASSAGAVPAGAMGAVRAFGEPLLASLKATGAKEVYVTLSSIELSTGKASVVVPSPDPQAAAQGLQAGFGMLPPALGYQVHTTETAAVACVDTVWDRLQGVAHDRTELSRSISATRGKDIAVVLAFAPGLVDSAVAVFPDSLPTSFPVQLSPKQVLRDIKAVTLSMSLLPVANCAFDFDCSDALASTRTKQQVDQLLGQAGIELAGELQDRRVSYTATSEKIASVIGGVTNPLQLNASAMQERNDLKKTIIALHNFYARYNALPPRATISPQRKPLLSWRVHLLPFIDQGALYKEFHLDEPWDSTHNVELVAKMPMAFQSKTQPIAKPGFTCIQAPMMGGSYWNGDSEQWMNFGNITDGNSNTICFVIAPAERAVPWTKPDDLQISSANVVTSLLGDRETISVAFFDGSVQTIERSIDPERLKAFLTHTGGEQMEGR